MPARAPGERMSASSDGSRARHAGKGGGRGAGGGGRGGNSGASAGKGARHGAGGGGRGAGQGGAGSDNAGSSRSGKRSSHRIGVTDARVVAAQVLEHVRSGELLDTAFERYAEPLDSRDRRWTRELVWGTLRSRSMLDALLHERVSGGLERLDADLLDLLRLGAQQLLHMGSVPPYAAIAQTVELAKRRHGIGASKLANAVLRRLDRDGPDFHVAEPEDAIDALALRESHPRWLVQRWLEQFGRADTERLLASNNQESAVYARPWGVSAEKLAESLREAGVEVAPSPLVEDSLRLGSMSSLTELGSFRRGEFFVQDPAATLVARFAAAPAGITVADLCAAPGGKALELARTAGMVIAGDRSESRLGRLRDNVERLGASNVAVVCADASLPPVGNLDMVLLDVPCTGTGTFRRHPDARWRLRQSDLAILGAVQRRLLAGAALSVRPGGLLVYSTCSLEREENEEQVTDFLARHPEWRLELPPDDLVPPGMVQEGFLRVLPQQHGVDGAFAARLRRIE